MQARPAPYAPPPAKPARPAPGAFAGSISPTPCPAGDTPEAPWTYPGVYPVWIAKSSVFAALSYAILCTGIVLSHSLHTPAEWLTAVPSADPTGPPGSKFEVQGSILVVRRLFVAKVEIKPHPRVVVRTLVCRHLSLIQPPLEGGRYVCGNLLHSNDFG